MPRSTRATAAALAAACLAASCAKSPQEMTCDDTQVQTDVRKLLALKLAEWKKPASTKSWMNDHALKQDPALAATLNGLKARSASADQIQLADIREVAKPQNPLADVEPAGSALPLPEALRPPKTGNKMLYQCAGTAKLALPAERVAQLPEASRALNGIEHNAINVAVQYQTELTPKGDMWVAVALANPLTEIVLRTVLADPDDTNAATE